MDVLQAIKTRRSVRSYSPRPIPEQALERMRMALRSAPSACNFQPWRFLFVTDGRLRQELARAANGQSWLAPAPVIVVACGLPEQAYQRMGGHGNSVDVDVGIALDHLTLAAVADGLGTCWIGAFDENEVKRLLRIPPAVKVVAMIPLGYPNTPELNRPLEDSRRKPPEEIFSTDYYDNSTH